MKFCLLSVTGQLAGKEHPLIGETFIGRSTAFGISDPHCSRRQLLIEVLRTDVRVATVGSGTCWFRRGNSPAFEQLREPVRLKAGDQIRLRDEHVFEVRQLLDADGADAAVSTASSPAVTPGPSRETAALTQGPAVAPPADRSTRLAPSRPLSRSDSESSQSATLDAQAGPSSSRAGRQAKPKAAPTPEPSQPKKRSLFDAETQKQLLRRIQDGSDPSLDASAAKDADDTPPPKVRALSEDNVLRPSSRRSRTPSGTAPPRKSQSSSSVSPPGRIKLFNHEDLEQELEENSRYDERSTKKRRPQPPSEPTVASCGSDTQKLIALPSGQEIVVYKHSEGPTTDINASVLRLDDPSLHALSSPATKRTAKEKSTPNPPSQGAAAPASSPESDDAEDSPVGFVGFRYQTTCVCQLVNLVFNERGMWFSRYCNKHFVRSVLWSCLD
eukprot:TRINITY_DN8949_c0_g1_i2.p1 TRINITY_DN8949_c0_g1~~TRINITY_DN8949_c0_g1_i2.p1  ORF type:complete len:442 (-),score=74.13 TRINITY_DN8949_c0_g1_i2:4-1329(-)